MNEISVDETVKWIEENCAEVSNFRFKTRLKTATPEKLRLKTAAPKFFSIFNTLKPKRLSTIPEMKTILLSKTKRRFSGF